LYLKNKTFDCVVNMSNACIYRSLDLVLAILGLVVLLPLLFLLYLLGLMDTGVPLLRQERLGRNRTPFVLVKFRTMRLETEHVASHLVNKNAVTSLGSILRRTKLDELPQLWNVLRGDMSMVGPRPGLPNQYELIDARLKYGVYSVRPGITGLAQVSRIDMSTPDLLARTDARMLHEMSLSKYIMYIIMTTCGKGVGDGVKKNASNGA
jgi:lipopolysaccharide/colanic/teichoic acid biosynthesis glycosyltransferase